MNSRRNWAVTLGIILGVVIGVVVSKGMDYLVPSAMAVGEEGKRIASEQAEIFRKSAKAIAPAVVNITTLQRVRYQEGGGFAFDDFGMPFYKRPKIREGLYPRGVGSGFVFDAKNGYVMTNN